MKEAIAGIVAVGLAICLAAGQCGEGEGVPPAPGRAADEAFLKVLRRELEVEPKGHMDAVHKKIDWAALAREAAKAPDADERARRQRLVKGIRSVLAEGARGAGIDGRALSVVKGEDGLKLTTVIDVAHEAAGRRKRIPLLRLVEARLASVTASARQEGIAVPPEFLARCRRSELGALEALARGADPDLAREATAALKAPREPADD